jgi:hypothetical protein
MFLVDTEPTFGVSFGTASVGTVTVTVTRSNGTAVDTNATTTDNANGSYSYQLAAADNDQIDTLRVDWKVVSSGEVVTLYEDIVGSLLFTIDQARAYTVTGQQTPLSSTTTYPDFVVARMREMVTEQFEQRTGRSWVSRHCRVKLHGNGARELSLRDGHARDTAGRESGGEGRHYDVQRLISVSVAGVAQDVADYTLHGRKVVGPTSWPRASWDSLFNVVIEYEYGVTPTNLEAEENGLRMVVANLVPSDLSAYAMTAAAAGESLAFPQQTGGLVWPPKVWDWLKANPARRIPSVA